MKIWCYGTRSHPSSTAQVYEKTFMIDEPWLVNFTIKPVIMEKSLIWTLLDMMNFRVLLTCVKHFPYYIREEFFPYLWSVIFCFCECEQCFHSTLFVYPISTSYYLRSNYPNSIQYMWAKYSSPAVLYYTEQP